ncbi:MAG: hypothetical protein HRJ53_07580 [Acidobacteria bacterium Pan2503]|uniref:Uncharacterized protein n=1 Tax=Candidatus Acidiferrum panamense TaxID=2741543 RepID=A0A7V8SWD7_9BACT|nr:hypothetical protein [Candidatus Acidoferrum panamensis]
MRRTELRRYTLVACLQHDNYRHTVTLLDIRAGDDGEARQQGAFRIARDYPGERLVHWQSVWTYGTDPQP